MAIESVQHTPRWKSHHFDDLVKQTANTGCLPFLVYDRGMFVEWQTAIFDALAMSTNIIEMDSETVPRLMGLARELGEVAEALNDLDRGVQS